MRLLSRQQTASEIILKAANDTYINQSLEAVSGVRDYWQLAMHQLVAVSASALYVCRCLYVSYTVSCRVACYALTCCCVCICIIRLLLPLRMPLHYMHAVASSSAPALYACGCLSISYTVSCRAVCMSQVLNILSYNYGRWRCSYKALVALRLLGTGARISRTPSPRRMCSH